MALCTTMSNGFTDTSLPYYPTALHELHTMYRSSWNKPVGNMEMQFAENFVRSLSVEGILPTATETRLYTRAISLFARQSSYDEDDESLPEIIPNDSLFLSIPDDDEHRYYSTKKPYPSPSKEHSLSSPPNGFKPIGIQLLARHGSRALTNHDYDIELLEIWQIAKEKNLLTKLGEQLEEDTILFMNANNLVG